MKSKITTDKDIAKLSDEAYWKQFMPNEEGGESNHEISINVNIKFFGLNGEIYETNEKNITCNPYDLEVFMNNLKRTIRMLDETKVDSDGTF